MILELVEAADYEAGHYERILLTSYFIDYIILWILEDDVKALVNEALGESADVEVVIGAYFEEYEVAVAGW